MNPSNFTFFIEHPKEVYVMKTAFTVMIADLILKTAPDIASRLEYQAEALREAECTKPVVGLWIDENDVKYLLSAFALEQKDFAARFPAMAHITEQERQQVITTIEDHLDSCPHCSLKRGYDLELDARIKQECQKNREILLQLLEEEEESDSSDEDDHESAELEEFEPAI
jgi:hypothetical protein